MYRGRIMPARKKKRREAGGPMTAAGLIRFYEEAEVGIKMKPLTIIAIAVFMIIVVAVLRFIAPPT